MLTWLSSKYSIFTVAFATLVTTYDFELLADGQTDKAFGQKAIYLDRCCEMSKMDWGQYNWPKSPLLPLSLTFMIVKGLFANASISLTTMCVRAYPF